MRDTTAKRAVRRAGASILLGVLALLVGGTAPLAGARAQEATVAAFDDTFWRWMQRHRVNRGLIAVARHGRAVHTNGFGMHPGTRVPVASLSKAVTAVCVADLIQQGRLAFATPLSQGLARTFQRLGGPADPRLAGVTIAQLLAHRAGYQREGKLDPMGSDQMVAHLRRYSAAVPAIDAQVQSLLRHPLTLAPDSRYAYTNATYLLLGAVIEEATGASYEAHCRASVLAPTGAGDARLAPQWRMRASYGGWEFTSAQYLAFHDVFALKGTVLTDESRRWLMSPEGKQSGSGAHYGLGTFVRAAMGAHDFWHDGRWTFHFKGPNAHLSANHGSYVARVGKHHFTWFAHYEPSVEPAALGELDRSMAAAGGSIRRWP